MLFELLAPFGFDSVNVTVYTPFGKFIGKGVRNALLEILVLVPLKVVICQLTVVDTLIPESV